MEGSYSWRKRTALLKWTPFNALVLLVVTLTLAVNTDPVSSLRDDWFGFVSFEDTDQWADTYEYTCGYKSDVSREPREFERRDRLLGRRELQTPIRFRSNEALKAPDNITLHIYNYPGVRMGHTVSYGFQRNKECLHGQDSDCVVFPETGRVRAVVVNAERFVENQNLNHIKDHFLIEKPERFVTILNGGSVFERRFYEAVFLGGYTKDSARTSHQIDGKKYPLEIYMYFLDETVPSVSLSTILVVLVEESDRDNAQVKPIVSAVEHKLYDAERRFLEENKAMIRRERLYHHLKFSTSYDPYDMDGREARNESVFQESLDSSKVQEGVYSRFVEAFERMQALESLLLFLLEDETRAEEVSQNLPLQALLNGQDSPVMPTGFLEYQMLAHAVYRSAYSYYVQYHDRPPTHECSEATEDIIGEDGLWEDPDIKSKQADQYQDKPTGEHLEDLIALTTVVCVYYTKMLQNLLFKNTNQTIMLQLKLHEKYELIRDYQEEREKRLELNQEIYDHFQGEHHNGTKPPNYASPQQAHEIMEAIGAIIDSSEKVEHYEEYLEGIRKSRKEIETRLQYETSDETKKIIRYLKYGSKQHDLQHFRAKVHEQYIHRTLPAQEKKRGLIELGGMGMTEKQIRDYEDKNPITVPVNEMFQISWLLPPDGGYYYYAGSSPIPPCFRAQNVIVFKRPIYMSKRQIEILTRVPTSFDRSEDIYVTTPRVHDTSFETEIAGINTEKSRVEQVTVPVYFQRRNHLFLGHDGIHKNAVEESERRKKKKNGARPVLSGVGKIVLGVGVMIVSRLFS